MVSVNILCKTTCKSVRISIVKLCEKLQKLIIVVKNHYFSTLISTTFHHFSHNYFFSISSQYYPLSHRPYNNNYLINI